MIHLFDLGSRRARKRKSRRTRMARWSHRCSMLQMTSVEAVPVVLTFGGFVISARRPAEKDMKESKEQCWLLEPVSCKLCPVGLGHTSPVFPSTY